MTEWLGESRKGNIGNIYTMASMEDKRKRSPFQESFLSMTKLGKVWLKRFKDFLDDIKIITASLSVLIKTIFLGVLTAEVWRLSTIASVKINHWINLGNHETVTFWVSGFSFLLLVAYALARGIYQDLKKVLISCRIDVLAALLFGIWLTVVWGDFFSKWYTQLVSSLNLLQLLTILAAPFLLALLVVGRALFSKDKTGESAFAVDVELENPADDLLNLTEQANNFAERVYNGGSPDSFVFGVDAPWGIGKSTFINFCRKHWDENYKNQSIIYKFSPLRHSGASNLLEVFIDGLIHAIQKDSFVPEIKPLISNYSRLLKDAGRFSLFGISIPSLTGDYTADDACDDLSAVLKRFPKKVIIVIDDLDRISFSEIKDILFVIRKSFAFPNVSYVICYDTENISILDAQSPDVEKISEFLEKFVNIKTSLYLDRKDLAEYVSGNLEKALLESTVDPLPLRQAIGGLLDIYKSSIYHNYLPFIGDVRKLKRLINTVLMFDVHSTDFMNSDFNKRDLINLLLIYIHYPNVFRKIYDTETDGGRGFFSLTLPGEEGYPPDASPGNRPGFSESEYRNSTFYFEYLKQFPEGSRQQFLLNQVFDAKTRLSPAEKFPRNDSYMRVDSVPEDLRTSLACFNGGWTNGRNLEAYLELIVKLSKPVEMGQHRFYANKKDEILSGEKTLEETFSLEQFRPDLGEDSHQKLWRILVNNARSLDEASAGKIINFLIDSIPKYSLLEIGGLGVGLRQNLDYFITRLLNDAGWIDPKGKHSENTPKHIREIADWIFGEGKHKDEGVIHKLSLPERGILGIHDLLLFRLSCSADRGGDIFDLSRALAQHAKEDAPTEGSTNVIAKEEMREISQKIFKIFEARYITENKNIFEEISALSVSDVLGQSEEYLKKQISEGRLSQEDFEGHMAELKTRVGAFVLYQLGNDRIEHGVGCGYYDPEGFADSHKIRELVNEYLFETCFVVSNPRNAEHFIDYLFRNFASVMASFRDDGRHYIPSIEEFTKVLDKTRLAVYWEKNSTTIKALKLEEKEKTIRVGTINDEPINVTYKEYVPLVYKVLDDNVEEVKKALAEALAKAEEEKMAKELPPSQNP